jgi:hypothetical protein
LDIERDCIVQDTADPNPASRPVSPRDDILRCRRGILRRINCCVWLDAPLKEDWASGVTNLTDAGWQNELAELRRDVVREAGDWRRANASNLWRREQYGDFLRGLGSSLERLELKCRNLLEQVNGGSGIPVRASISDEDIASPEWWVQGDSNPRPAD